MSWEKEVRGKPASITAKLPLWRAKGLYDDIQRVKAAWELIRPVDRPMYPLDLHELGEAIKVAIREAEA